MNPVLLEFDILLLILLLMIAYAGVEGTLRVFVYFELLIKIFIIDIQKWFLKRKLKRQLDIDYAKFYKEMEELKNAKGHSDKE
jgi:hypothetical protein